MHGAGRRSPIHLAQITTGVQRSFIAPGTHPRPTLRATTPPPPPRARTTRSNAFPPCPEILRTMRPLQRSSPSAQLTRISAPRFQPPDRPHDHGFDRAHDRALRAHTRTRRPRAHTRHATDPTAPRTHAMPHTTHAHAQLRTHALGLFLTRSCLCPILLAFFFFSGRSSWLSIPTK